MGVLDLPAPLLDLLDGALGAIAPAALRVALYGATAGALGMLAYARLSNQPRLHALATEQSALQRELAKFDGEFAALRALIARHMRVSWQRVAATLGPALLASLPVLFLAPWLSNRFDVEAPAAGQPLCARPIPAAAADRVRFEPGAARWDASAACWPIEWPAGDRPLELVDAASGRALTRLPWPAPAGAIYRASAWEWVAANPAGALPADGPLDALALDVAPRELVAFGPRWMRGWVAVFFAGALAGALLVRSRRKLV